MKYYDKKLLRFLYELTKLKSFLSYENISKELSKKGLKISPKTVERWFNLLSKDYPHKAKNKRTQTKNLEIFHYFPTFFYEKLGLIQTYTLIEDPVLKRIEKFSYAKYMDYLVWLYDPSLKKDVLMVSFALPVEFKKDFLAKMNSLKKNKHIKNHKTYFLRKGFNMYSPWHKTIDEHGIFNSINEKDPEIENQISEFLYFQDNLPPPKIIDEVKKNPLILPAVFEQYRSGKSSVKAWELLKSKIGSKVWDYIPKKKKKSDSVGIKRMQQALKQTLDLNILHQMKVGYMPLELKHNLIVYYILDFKNKDRKAFLRTILQNSIYVGPRVIDKNRIFFMSLISGECIPKILEVFEKVKVERLLFLKHEKSLPLLTNKKFMTFNYNSCFDPVKVRWKS